MTETAHDELAYHLRELRADLSLIAAALDAAVGAGALDASVVRNWVQADALLEHDLEVHLPRALELLDAAAPPVSASRPPTGPGRGDWPTIENAAKSAAPLVRAASAALGADQIPLADRLIGATRKIDAARRTVARTRELVLRLAADQSDLE